MGGPGFGAFVVSFDFELHWGVRDHMPPDGSYRQNLLGSRVVIPRLLKLFEHYDLAATWAIVGFLFASSGKELARFRPAILPEYSDVALNPYAEPTGSGSIPDLATPSTAPSAAASTRSPSGMPVPCSSTY